MAIAKFKPTSAIVLLFFNHKGGVGKTTNTLNVADALAREKYRVALIDLDPQHNSTSLLLPGVRIGKSVRDLLLEQESKAEEILQEAMIHETSVDGVSCLPATLHLASAENLLRSSAVAHPLGFLRRRVKPLLSQFDFILIDVSPTLTTLPGNALAAATHLIVPFKGGDHFGLEGYSDLVSYVREIQNHGINPDLQILGSVINGHDRRESAQQAVEKDIGDKLAVIGSIPRQANVEKATYVGKTVLGFDRTCTASRAYVELTRTMVRLIDAGTGGESR